MPGSSSWMPCAPQAVKGFDDDDDYEIPNYTPFITFYFLNLMDAVTFLLTPILLTWRIG